MAERAYLHHGTTFVWGTRRRPRKTVFDDPLFVLQDASRNAERRDAAIGFSSTGRLLTVVHIEVHDEFIRLISARRASPAEETTYAQ
jgi:uncharacterized protein